MSTTLNDSEEGEQMWSSTWGIEQTTAPILSAIARSAEFVDSTNAFAPFAAKLQEGLIPTQPNRKPATPCRTRRSRKPKDDYIDDDDDLEMELEVDEEEEEEEEEESLTETSEDSLGSGMDDDEEKVDAEIPRETFMMNPVHERKKRVKIVLSDDDEENDIGSVASGGSREKHNSSDESDEEDSTTIALLMAKCESISENLKRVLVNHEEISNVMTEMDAQAMIDNDNLKLKPYQIAGVNWLSVLNHQNMNGVLADEMGLGKTIQAVSFLKLLLKRDGVRGPHLIVAPASTLENWRREISMWLPELVAKQYTGTQQERSDIRREAKKDPKAVDVWITGYTYFERESCKDDRSFLYSLDFEVCIYDEAHAIKNTESQRYQSLVQLQSRRRLLLSGTPVQNKLDELFALLSFCLPSIFNPKQSKLRKRIFGSESDPERVKRILAPFILRRLKSQVLDQLTPKSEEVIILKMLPEQQALYDKVLSDYKQFRSGEGLVTGRKRRSVNATVTSESVFTELRKISNHPLLVRRRFGQPGRDLKVVAKELLNEGFFGKRATMKMIQDEVEGYSDWELNSCCLHFPKNRVLKKMILPEDDMFDASAKAAKLRELIPDLVSKGHRILLFSQWTKLLDVFEELLTQISIRYMRLDGGTAVDDRQNLVDEFNGGLASVFLLSTRAGGLGINLTSADVVILHDLDFNPSIDSQAMDRCHRIGQQKKVRVIKLVIKGTVDESIFKIQLRKFGLNKVVLGEDGLAQVMVVEEAKQANANQLLLPTMQDFEEGIRADSGKDDEKNLIQEAINDALGIKSAEPVKSAEQVERTKMKPGPVNSVESAANGVEKTKSAWHENTNGFKPEYDSTNEVEITKSAQNDNTNGVETAKSAQHDNTNGVTSAQRGRVEPEKVVDNINGVVHTKD